MVGCKVVIVVLFLVLVCVGVWIDGVLCGFKVKFIVDCVVYFCYFDWMIDVGRCLLVDLWILKIVMVVGLVVIVVWYWVEGWF